MATATFPAAHAGEIKFTYGTPETFSLKFLEPKTFDGQYGPRGMFTACDEGYGERKIWLDFEDARNVMEELKRLGIRKGEPLCVTKIKHPRGGGHGYLVRRAAAPDNAPDWVREDTTRQDYSYSDAREEAPSPLEAQLHQSLQMVRKHGRDVFQRPAEAPAPAPVAPAECALAAALKTAIDAAIDAETYAAGKGKTLAFNEEDVRALAATLYIQAAKGGR